MNALVKMHGIKHQNKFKITCTYCKLHYINV